MDLYTLTENFLPEAVVDEFSSVVWTERYSEAGDVQLVTPAYPEYIDMLREGTYLGMAGTKEVMQLQTQSIEKGLLTVLGKSLLAYLDERLHWNRTTDSSQPIGDLTQTAKLGELISDRVSRMVITGQNYTGNPWENLNLDWEDDKIPGLTLGAIDASGIASRWTIPIGPLYSVISKPAKDDGLGLSLYLEYADPISGYSLKFTTYRGVDRTSDQSAVPLLRLSPDLESMTGLKEVRSIDGYKNVVYVIYKNILYTRYEDPNNIPVGRDRRVMVTDAEGEPVGHKEMRYGGYGSGGGAMTPNYGGAFGYLEDVVGAEDIAKFIDQNAKDALANHNYIRAVDGEVSRANEYVFGVDYGLGDILELEGLTGIIQKARVTEFIRAQDNKGEQSYPTLAVVT